MASLVIIYPAAHGVRFPLRVGAMIGRAQDCAIRIDEHGVSRHHARIGFGVEGWFIEDLDSMNGTYVNDFKVRRAAVREPDQIRVGHVILKVIGGVESAPSRPPSN
jgi:pSer/pThr/pTyr-binding forkhead associated (FHA) protein